MMSIAAHRFAVVSGVVLMLAALVPPANAAEGEGLAWRLKPNQEFGYEITITADKGSAVDHLKGTAVYKVTSVKDNQITLRCVSGLRSQETAKQPAGGGGRPGRFRRPGGPPRMRGPFSAMTGLMTQTNDLTINRTGEVQSLRGTSQLPYLLGNASMLPLEELPGDVRDQWSINKSIGVTESGDRMPRPHFLADQDRKTTNGSEVTTYKIEGRKPNEVTVRKTYDMTIPGADGQAKFKIQGNGTLVYDSQQGLPRSMDFKETLTARVDNATVEVPITIAYRLLSPDEIRKIEEQRQKAIAEAQAKFAEQKKKDAEPLTAAERKELLTDLKSNNDSKIIQALTKLNRRPPAKDDKQLTAAIRSLLNHKNFAVKRYSTDAWAKYSAEDGQ